MERILNKFRIWKVWVFLYWKTLQQKLTHFGFVFECMIAIIANAMEMSGTFTKKNAEVCIAFFGSAEPLETVG